MNEIVSRQQNHPKLWKLTYTDNNAGIRLTNFADTIVFDQREDKKILTAVRFGGYPEQVKGMADAIYGGGTIYLETEKETIAFQSLVKQYRRMVTHDGLYAEATLLIEDDGLKNNTPDKKTDETKVGVESKILQRANYIFCEQGSTDQLFEEIDKKVSVPLIPEFKDYLISTLQKQNILKKLTMMSFRERFDAWKIMLTVDDKNLINVVEEGLKNKKIKIPDSVVDNPFKDIHSVSGYLNQFGVMISEKIKAQFNPLFDPTSEMICKEIVFINENIIRNARYSLYNAQLAEAEALKRRIDRGKVALCIAECGSGKSKIGATALCSHQMGKGQKKCFNIVLCPSHLTKKWVRELEESLPNTFAVHINSINELNRAYHAYLKDNKNCYIIISKEKARDGYMKRPAVRWNKRMQAFLCPRCFNPIMMDIINDGSKYKIEADHFYFQKENSKNHKCTDCGSELWVPLMPKQQSDWVKISNYGFVHRKFANIHLSKLKSKVMMCHKKDISFPQTYYDIEAVVKNPEGIFHAAGAYRRFPLSTYIKKKMHGKIDGLIIDELQDYNNNSGQGDAMNELLCCAKKSIGLTGTLINGYSQGIFYLLYRIAPHLMQIDDKKYNNTNEFNNEYGVTENVYQIAEAEYNSNRRTIRKKLRERQLPGVSPLVYSRFLMETAAFLSLNDMGKQLPDYIEIPIGLNLDEKMKVEYKRLENAFIDVLKKQKDIAKRVISAFMSLLTVYPDQPYDMKPIVHPHTGQSLVTPANTSSLDSLNEKDVWILEKVKEKIFEGSRVIVYTSWIRIDTQKKLLQLFKDNDINAAVLTVSISPNKREEWVEKQVAEGVQVLIVNPALVETGLDLNDFPTLIYYNIGYKLFTLRQSSRRSWRINQKAPRVEVYFLYFKDVMQHRAIRLMASKLAVAGIIEGNFTDEGLSAMSECQDLTTLLAQELTLGIKNDVEDLGAMFKKMAILKTDLAPVEHVDTIVLNEQALLPALSNQVSISENRSLKMAPAQEVNSLQSKKESLILSNIKTSFIPIPNILPTKKKKTIYVDENQLSLFDAIDVSA